MSGPNRVILSTDLTEFFRDQVTDARSDLGVQLPEITEYYLVNLLCEFSRGDSTPVTPGEEPLALIYKRALEAPLADRIQILKNLGDVALYVSGFFAEFIERSLVDIDYYISMGGRAYNNLSGLVGSQPNGHTFVELYTELARRFTVLVDLLAQIADRSRPNLGGDEDLLKLYDRWARTGSQRIQKLLVEKGLVPPNGLPTEYIQ